MDLEETTVPTRQRLAGYLPLLLVWLVALWPFALWLLRSSDPELAVRVTRTTMVFALRIGMAATIVAALAALAFPPFPAWIRLQLARIRLGYANDRSPLLKALSELEHFQSASKHLEIGRLALIRSELPLAAQHLARAVELDDSIPGAHQQLGQLLLRLDKPQLAVVAFRRAEELDPGHAFGEALLGVGRSELLLGNEQRAAQVLEEHAREHGGSRKSHYWLGKARAAVGDKEQAIAAMKFAAAPPEQRLTAEENWFRALARVWLWRGSSS